MYNYIYDPYINNTWIIPFPKLFINLFELLKKTKLFVRFYRAPELLLGSTDYNSQVLVFFYHSQKFEVVFLKTFFKH